MPGMLETVLDIGLNERSVEGLIRLTGNPRLAWDSDRRLVQGYAEVVAGLPTEPFDAVLREAVAGEGAENERDLDHRALRRLSAAMRDRYAALAGTAFPADPLDQVASAAEAVFRSWDAPKAVAWRRLNGLDDLAGTAVTVQTMVFGNAGGTSGAGVGFTRDPATGERALYFDFCCNGQGEDVVAGRRTLADGDRLRALLPDAFHALEARRHPAGGAVPRRPGFRVHRAGGQIVPAANPPRPAHAAGGPAHGGGHGRGRAGDTGGSAAPAGRFGPGVARPHALRAASAGAAGAGGGGWCRRGQRARRAGRSSGGTVRRGRHAGHPGPAGDVDRRHRRPGRCRRAADRRRQPHRPRRGRRPPTRQGVRGGLRRSGDRPGAAPLPDRRQGAGRGRPGQPRRQYRCDLRRGPGGADRASRA